MTAPLPGAIERQLRPYGVVRVEAHPQWPIAMQAAETLRQLWDNMRDWGVVVWFDNCYKPRYVYNSLRMRASMNATAISVLAICTIPPHRNGTRCRTLDPRLLPPWIFRLPPFLVGHARMSPVQVPW